MLESRPLGRIRFQLLGPAGLFAGHANSAVRVSGQKGFALLAYLAMNASRPVGRAVLADLLWGDRVEAQARQSLRQALLTLRRDLGAAGSANLHVDDQSLSLAVEAEDVDALQFAALAASPDPAQRQRCLDIPWGPFLANFSVDAEPFDEWVLAERHRLDAIATRVFSDLAKQFDAAGDGERAILALERLVAIDPVEEARHRRLLALEARYRGVDAALARGRELAAMLKREVDAEQEPATVALLEDIRRKGATVTDIGAQVPRSVTDRPAPQVDADARPASDSSPPKSSPWPTWLPRTRKMFGERAAMVVASLGLISAGAALVWVTKGPQHRPTIVAAAPDSWQSPALPSKSADDSIARGRGLVAIAVLPFRSYSEDGNKSLVAEMVTDDLTYLLSRIPVFRVISYQTATSYRGQNIDAGTIGAELGVHYLVEGNASMLGNTLRVNVALVDAITRLQIWTGRFERSGEDRHAVQTEIVNGLARELQVSVTTFENGRISKNPDVHELIFRGFAAIQATRLKGVEALRPAEAYFRQALERDPDAVRAQVGLGAYHAHMAVQLFAPDPAPHLAKAEAILHQAIARHPNLSEAYPPMGLVHVARRQMKKAKVAFQRAIELNPSDAPSYAQFGRALVSLGNRQAGLDHIRYAMRLSPRDPILGYWLAFAGYAYLELGRYDEAADSLGRAHATNPTQPRTMLTYISALAMAGRMSDARLKLEQLQKTHPHLTRETILQMYRHVGGRKQTTEGIRRALAADGADRTGAIK